MSRPLENTHLLETAPEYAARLDSVSRWRQGRRRPYTELGVRRLGCWRCGRPARFQWQCCADGNAYRPLCASCDVALNELVLLWAGDPDAEAKLAVYRARVL